MRSTSLVPKLIPLETDNRQRDPSTGQKYPQNDESWTKEIEGSSSRRVDLLEEMSCWSVMPNVDLLSKNSRNDAYACSYRSIR